VVRLVSSSATRGPETCRI